MDGQVECPFHGFRFQADGACTAIPAQPDRRVPAGMALAALTVREAHGFVWCWTGEQAPTHDPPFFDFEGWTWTGSGVASPMANHYSRGIENQLDFPHLPFVHRNTIGRSLDPAMEVVTTADGDHITAQLPHGEARVELIAPGIWRLRTGPTWQFLAFVPVDDGAMVYYQRTYRRFADWPGIGAVVGRLMAWSGQLVLRQDIPPVESQPVGEVRLRSGERLIEADGPIIAYRRWREAVRAPFEPGRGASADRRREDADAGGPGGAAAGTGTQEEAPGCALEDCA